MKLGVGTNAGKSLVKERMNHDINQQEAQQKQQDEFIKDQNQRVKDIAAVIGTPEGERVFQWLFRLMHGTGLCQFANGQLLKDVQSHAATQRAMWDEIEFYMGAKERCLSRYKVRIESIEAEAPAVKH